MRIIFAVWLSIMAVLTATLAIGGVGHAATINWKGHTWEVTAGSMAGVCQGSAANIAIDSDGYLHMKITNSGGTWTAAEIFTTDKIGFGTYQWQIDGPVDKLDKNVVVGLYPYGPQAGIGSDGQNEIDIEYARWGNASYPNGNYTVYPPTGTGSNETTFDFTLTGTYTTSRFAWSSTKIDFVTMSGFEPLDSTAGLIKAWTFAPASPATKIPQQALPLGMNLWCFQGEPSNGQNVEIIVRDFTFVPLGAAIDAGASDSAAAGGASGTSETGGSGGGNGGMSGSGGRAGTGGAVGVGGFAITGGATGAETNGGSTGSAGNPVGGAAGTAGSEVTAGASGSGGSRGTGGVSGAGGAMGSSGAVGVGGSEASGGCSCSTAAAHSAISGQTWIVFAGMLFIVRRRRNRLRDGQT